MAPGVIVLTLLGDSLKRIIANPTPGTVATIVGAIAAWVGLGLGFQKLIDVRRQRKTRAKSAN